ncbi:MAG: hypothetical protein WBC63_04355 [Candidatus Bipolaricaulia bacterium]
MLSRGVLVLSILVGVSLCSAAQSGELDVSGYFREMIQIDPQATTIAEFFSSETLLHFSLAWDAARFESELTLSEVQSSSLRLTGQAWIGANRLSSQVGFNTMRHDSHYWNGTFETNMLGTTLETTFLLVRNPDDPTPEDLKVDFMLRGQTVSGMTITAITTFGDYVDPTGQGELMRGLWPNSGDTDGVCDLPFAGAEIEVSGFGLCCAESRVALAFDCGGFDNIVFTIYEVRIENLPWLSLSGSLTFAPEEKLMSILPRFDFGAFECNLTIQASSSTDLTSGNLPSGDAPTVKGIGITGIDLLCSLGEFNVRAQFYNAERSSSISIDNHPSGQVEKGCCEPFVFDVEVVFRDDSESLFDLSFFEGRAFLTMTPQFSWNMQLYLHFDPAPMYMRLEFGFEVSF